MEVFFGMPLGLTGRVCSPLSHHMTIADDLISHIALQLSIQTGMQLPLQAA